MLDILDTICAPATGAVSGAISVIRVSGPSALQVADSVIRLRNGYIESSEGYSLKYGEVPGIDDVLVSIFRAPHSYTGEDSVEISCHASGYVVSAILERLVRAGARMAEPGEFTRRAFVNGKMDLAQAEAVADLIASSSEASHRVAVSQLKGGFSKELDELRSRLVELAALLELELDFSEEEVEFAKRADLEALLEKTIAHVERLSSSFGLGNAIRSGVPVAIAGPANSGKSTLLNALLGEERALVSSIAGTTRDTVEETFVLDGVQYRFIDTAGIRESHDRVERMGIDRTFEKLSQAFIVLGVLDATASLEEDRKALTRVLEHLDLTRQTLLVLRNKVDLYDAILPEEYPAMDRSYGVLELRYPAFGTFRLDPVELGCRLAEECREAALIQGGNPRGAAPDGGNLRNGALRGVAPDDGNPRGAAPDGGNLRNGALRGVDGQGGFEVIDVSARTGEGLDELRKAISGTFAARYGATDADTVLVCNARHHEALLHALDSLYSVRNGLTSGLATDLLASDLRDALRHLGSITGSEILPDEVLGTIFSRFCIGK